MTAAVEARLASNAALTIDTRREAGAGSNRDPWAESGTFPGGWPFTRKNVTPLVPTLQNSVYRPSWTTFDIKALYSGSSRS